MPFLSARYRQNLYFLMTSTFVKLRRFRPTELLIQFKSLEECNCSCGSCQPPRRPRGTAPTVVTDRTENIRNIYPPVAARPETVLVFWIVLHRLSTFRVFAPARSCQGRKRPSSSYQAYVSSEQARRADEFGLWSSLRANLFEFAEPGVIPGHGSRHVMKADSVCKASQAFCGLAGSINPRSLEV